MEFQRKVPIESIVNPSDVVIVNLNFTQDNYEKCFSKLEFNQGMDYLSWAIRKFDIPTLFIRNTNEPPETPGLAEYRRVKEYNRAASSAPISSYDEKFNEYFKQFHPGEEARIIDVKREDAFFESSLKSEIKKLGKVTVMVTGFFTEADVYITAVGAMMNDFYSVVISDVTSTYSERVFFQSLDMVSQVVEVIDTRDLEKIWGRE